MQCVDPTRELVRPLSYYDGMVVIRENHPGDKLKLELFACGSEEVSEPVSPVRRIQMSLTVLRAGGDEEREAAIRPVRRAVSLLGEAVSQSRRVSIAPHASIVEQSLALKPILRSFARSPGDIPATRVEYGYRPGRRCRVSTRTPGNLS
jgi:hypothetical protein